MSASPPAVSAPGVYRSGSGRVFTIRRCAALEELDDCVALQQQVWGYSDLEVVPRNLFVLAQALGGHSIGAWDEEGVLAGFALAVAAHAPAHSALAAGTPPDGNSPSAGGRFWMRPVGAPRLSEGTECVAQEPAPPSPYLHSHMLAVTAAHRDCGLGFALKLAQRQDALACGIRRMRWTFDPLVAKNAFFNLQRLGATAQQYIENFYGRLHSSLAAGLPTDRLVAVWELDGPRVEKAIEARQRRLTAGAGPAAEPPGGEARSAILRIELPPQLAMWKQQRALAEAEQAQATVRAQFAHAFEHGLRATGFIPDPAGGGAYVLTDET